MKAILISGKSGSGKDQFANYVHEYLDKKDYRVLTIHFADAVKFFAREYYNWNGEKDVVGRTLLQRLGTDIVRKKYPNFWGEIVGKFIAATEQDWDYVLIPDWRFANEYIVVNYYNKDTITVRINRLNADGTFYLNPNLTEEQHHHSSECDLDDYYCDYMIDNSHSLEDLQEQAKEFVKEILKKDEFSI